MENFHNNYIRIFFWFSFLILGLFLLVWGLIIKSFSLSLIGCMIACGLLFPVIYSIEKSKKIVQDFTNEKITNEFYSEPYHSIIIANSTKQSKSAGIFVGIDLLIKRIKSQKCKYKITLCNTPVEVKNEIENQNAEYIYLFGHGFKGGLTLYFSESTFEFKYCSVNPKNFKKFIGQFHCNDGNEQSLVELLMKEPNLDNHYFINGYTTTFLLWYDIRFKVLKMIKKC
jgi:hypothetical protein